MRMQLRERTLSDWSQLEVACERLKKCTLTDLFKNESRAKQYSLEVDSLFLDYSKNFIDEEVFALLIQLAKNANLEEAIRALFAGETVNTTENRAAGHTALRSDLVSPVMINGNDVAPIIRDQKEKMYQMVQQLNSKKWLGATGKPITDIVNLGIGGSDLGPVMALKALNPYCISDLNIHFASNIDPEVMTTLLNSLNPESTLFIISSKSFSTPETLTNAMCAREWLEMRLRTKKLDQHFIAITANNAKAQAFGINDKHILDFWDWVGGRFSIWSAIGFVLALSIGQSHFEEFLAGGRSMDHHFMNSPFEKNMPVIMGLIGIWYNNFWGAHSYAILPYLEALKAFPDYLQQLDMESNGKSVTKEDVPVSYNTGPIIWGQAGTNGQHAFYQLLHQGTHLIPIDFILFAKSRSNNNEQHMQLVANGLAQSAALFAGHRQVQHRYEEMPGNKPSNTLLFKSLTPFALGQLIALYEHKVYVQGVIWNINSFDQPGVELGKKMANQVVESLKNKSVDWDSSTAQLIQKIMSY